MGTGNGTNYNRIRNQTKGHRHRRTESPHEELTLVLAEFEGRVLSKRLSLGRFRLENGDIYGKFRHYVSSPISVSTLKSTDSPNWQPERVKRLEQITATFSAVEQHFNEIRRLFGRPEMQYRCTTTC